MDGAGRARSAELLRELVREARAAEDDAWAFAAEARRRQASGNELAEALQVIEAATATRVRLEAELRQLGAGSPPMDA